MILPDPSDHDRFLIAAAINLYLESLRRTSGRGLLVPSDIPTLFEMINILTSERPAKPEPGPTRELTEAEVHQVMTVPENFSGFIEQQVPGSITVRRHVQ
jgi:hypothetical protein